MTRLYFGSLISLGHSSIVRPNFSTFRAFADIDPCHLATRHLGNRVQHWSHEHLAMCFDIFSIADPRPLCGADCVVQPAFA